MKIIGHRGAAGLATENTITSLRKAIKAKVDYIEIDVRKTRDDKLVLSHDNNLSRVFGVNLNVSEHTLDELHTVCPELLTLDDAFKAAKKTGLIIELKEYISPTRILRVASRYPDTEVRYASFNHHVLKSLKKQDENVFCYVLEHHSPFEIVQKASKMQMDGIGLNYGVLNPLTYFLAKRKRLHIYTYTVNNSWIMGLINFFYPDAYICTDYPNQKHKS